MWQIGLNLAVVVLRSIKWRILFVLFLFPISDRASYFLFVGFFSFIFLATKRNMSESLFGCLCAVWHEFWCRKTCS